MDRVYAKQINKINRKEKSFLETKEIPLVKNKISPLMEKIQDKIPEKLNATLETAFYKSFKVFFEKGNKYIEKTYNKDNKQFEFEINDYAIDKKFNNMSIKRLDKPSLYSNALNTSFSILEGGVLGVLGIGLPDIPIFISLIIKTINEVALSYGFDYNTVEEKAYILLLICTAMSKQEQQKEFYQKLEKLGVDIDDKMASEIDLEELIKTTAGILSESLLVAKFIQGIPLVGAVGGFVNYNIIRKISKFAGVKYKKRYYLNKQKRVLPSSGTLNN